MIAGHGSLAGVVVLAAFGMAGTGCASSSAPPVPAPKPPTEHTTTGSAPVDWPVPPEEAARVNPLQATSGNLNKGHTLFKRYCTACHGVGGRGDGPMAQQWSRLPKDLTHPDRQARLTDGEIFWKMSAGHRLGADEIMPAVGYKIGVDDRWRLVLYVRSLVARQ